MTRLQRVRMPYATISLQTTQQKKKKRTPEKPYFVAVAFSLSLSLSLKCVVNLKKKKQLDTKNKKSWEGCSNASRGYNDL